MVEYLVELYVSRADAAELHRLVASARLAAEQLTSEGTAVQYLSSLFVPEDETCFFVYEADTADAVRDAATRAALPFERIAAAVAPDRRTT